MSERTARQRVLNEGFAELMMGVKVAPQQQGETMSETNRVVEKLIEIVEAAPNTYIAHGRRTYALSDPACPEGKVTSFVKTQLDKLAQVASDGE